MTSVLGVFPEGGETGVDGDGDRTDIVVGDRADTGVRVLARGLVLLQAFSPRNQSLSNGELAIRCGLPKATVSRITATLTRLGYLDYLVAAGRYRLGYGALALGFGVLSTLDVRVRARVHMQRFADQNDLLVVLAVRDQLAMVCQEVCRGRGALTIRVGVGSRLALPHSAMGRAWIASLPPERLQALLQELRPAFDPAALQPHFAEAAAQIAANGFCVTVSSLEPDVNSLGTLVDLPQMPGQYVLGCSVPAFRYPPERCRQELGPRLLALRQLIQDDLSAGLPGGST